MNCTGQRAAAMDVVFMKDFFDYFSVRKTNDLVVAAAATYKCLIALGLRG